MKPELQEELRRLQGMHEAATDQARRLVERAERAEAALRRTLEIIDSINQCHGCLDQRPTLKAEVEQLRREQQ